MSAQLPINERGMLAEWLASDIGDIRDGRVMDQLLSFADSLPSDCELGRAVERIRRCGDAAEQLRLANQALRDAFVATTLTEERYREHAASLQSGEELAHRRESRDPLPGMDALLLLARDPGGPSQTERAAKLTAAALRLHAAERGEDVPILGTTLVPGETVDNLVKADGETRILVLARCVAYTVRLGVADVDPQWLGGVFETVLRDSDGATAQAIPSLATAAQRNTCHQIRRILETEPANRAALQAIDGCLFAVCLDAAAPASPWSGDEAASRRLFCTHGNRWYGMTCLAVDAEGEAGIVASYTRGIEAVPAIAFADALYRESLTIGWDGTTAECSGLPAEVTRIDFHKVELGDLEAQAESEIAGCFHNEQAFFEIGIGSELLQSLGMSPNSALQFLIMLAAQESYGSVTVPAVSHAVSTREGAGLKGGLDWIVVSTTEADRIRTEGIDGLRRAAAEHAAKVKMARQGYSPTSFIRKPATDFDQRLYRFFADLGSRYETAYRSYLFRATRWPGAMDILTSTVKLPESVRFLGRPGATCEVASMFGLHIIIERERTRLFFIPHMDRPEVLRSFHNALQQQVSRLRDAAANSNPREEQSVCA